MLVFHPEKRYTVEECLAHPYLKDFHDPSDEPTSDDVFDWDWSLDDLYIPISMLREILYEEACKYHPE